MVSTERATILYVSKGGYGCADDSLKGWGIKEQFSPFKEFEIARNDAATQYLSDRAKIVKDFREGKTAMPHGLCATAMSKRAKGCSQVAACWSGKFPPGHKWEGCRSC
jgi:hypothetical protein